MKKKLLMLFLMTILVFSCVSGIAQAQTLNPINLNSAPTSLIMSGTVNLGANGNTLTVSGWTDTYYPVDYIGVKLYIQRYENNTWVNYYYWNIAEAYNTDTVSDIHSLNVPGGYWYRAMAKHVATDGGINELVYSYSYSTYVN